MPPPHAAGAGHPPAPSRGRQAPPPYIAPAEPPVASPPAAPAIDDGPLPDPEPALGARGGYSEEPGGRYEDEEFFDDEAAHRRPAPEDFASAYDQYEDEFADEPPRRRGLGAIIFALAIVLIALIAAAVVYFFNKSGGGGTTPARTNVPVIQPQQTPIKVKPETPPAAKKPAGRKQIYDRILEDGQEPPERVVPGEEKPLPLPDAPPVEDQGSGDALPLPLPPPPGMDGGQGAAPAQQSTTKTARMTPQAPQANPASAPPEASGGRQTASLPPVPPPMAGEPEAPSADAARDGTAPGQPTGQATPQTMNGAGGEAKAKERAARQARERKAQSRRKKELARRKAQEKRRKKAQRLASRAPAAARGPVSILPPAAGGAPAVRAYAPPPVQAAPRPIAPPPAVPPRKVTNFNSGRKVTNFTSAHPATSFKRPPQAPARVAALPPRTPPQAATPRARPPRATAPRAAAPTGKGYVVQLASYRSQADALREYQRIRARHARLLGALSPRIQKKNLGAAGTFYRLGVGPLASRAQASKLCNALIASGERDCLVRRQ